MKELAEIITDSNVISGPEGKIMDSSDAITAKYHCNVVPDCSDFSLMLQHSMVQHPFGRANGLVVSSVDHPLSAQMMSPCGKTFIVVLAPEQTALELGQV